MSDERTRDLERRARGGDHSACEELDALMVRSGRQPAARVVYEPAGRLPLYDGRALPEGTIMEARCSLCGAKAKDVNFTFVARFAAPPDPNVRVEIERQDEGAIYFRAWLEP